MPDPGSDAPEPPDPAEAARLAEQTRRRLAEVFGDVLPSTTADERDDRDAAAPDPDSQLLADRPPHHDRDR
jgi:hypothetical protein